MYIFVSFEGKELRYVHTGRAAKLKQIRTNQVRNLAKQSTKQPVSKFVRVP
jgi:hypothetical protein